MKIRAMCVAGFFALGACGGGGGSGGGSTGSGTVVPPNTPPVAEAGSDVSSGDNTTVSLSGSGSDSDGTISSMVWRQVSGPSVGLTDNGDGTAEIVIGDVGSSETVALEFRVTDNDGASATDSVSIQVSNTSSRLVAALGPLDGAIIEVFPLRPIDGTPIFMGETNETGEIVFPFDLLELDQALYVVRATGGLDTDVDDDGVRDDTPTANLGSVHAIVTPDQLRSPNGRVSMLSDIVWQFLEPGFENVSDADLSLRITDMAAALLRLEINQEANGVAKLYSFDPSQTADRAELTFDYEALLEPQSGQTMSVVELYHSGDASALRAAIYDLFGSRLSKGIETDSRFQSVKITLDSFGPGSVSSSGAELNVNYNARDERMASAFVDKSNKLENAVLLTAAPNPGAFVALWEGCESVSEDNLQCRVLPDQNKLVRVMFGSDTYNFVDGIVDLSDAQTTLDNDFVNVRIEHNDLTLVDLVSNLRSGDYIVGGGIGKSSFLRKIETIERISEYRYRFATSFAALDEILIDGTVIFDHQYTNDDVVAAALLEKVSSFPNVSSEAQLGKVQGLMNEYRLNGKLPSTSITPNGLVPIGNRAGVYLVPSQDPSDEEITVRFGASKSDANLSADKTFGFEFPFPRIQQSVEFEASNGQTASVSGDIQFTLRMQGGWDFTGSLFSGPGLDGASVVAKISGTENLDISYSGELSFPRAANGDPVTMWKLPIDLPLPDVKLPTSPPIYLKNDVEIYWGLDGDISAEATTGMDIAQSIEFGFSYQSTTGFRTISDKQWSANWDPFQAKVEASGRAYLRFRVNTLLYGIVGPKIDVDPYFEIRSKLFDLDFGNTEIWDTDVCTSDEFVTGMQVNVDFGVNASAGLQVEDRVGNIVRTIFGDFIDDLGEAENKLKVELVKVPIYQDYVGEECEQRPVLEVLSDHMTDRTFVGSNEVLTHEIVLRNRGGDELSWEAVFRQDGALSVSPASGAIAPNGGEQIVRLDVNTTGLAVGDYGNMITFRNLTGNTVFSWLTGQSNGTQDRSVLVSILPGDLPAPQNLKAEPTSDTNALISWDYNSSYQFLDDVAGFKVYQTLTPADESSWRLIELIGDNRARSSAATGLPQGVPIYFRVEAFTKTAASDRLETSVLLPRTAPIGSCQAFFTGAIAADQQSDVGISRIFVEDAFSEFVGAGTHPRNSDAFPKAVASTFDGIAFDSGTRVIIYAGENFTGDVLYDRVGPAVVNNFIWRNDSRYGPPVEADWIPELQAIFPQSVREWSASNMHEWSGGSLLVECGY